MRVRNMKTAGILSIFFAAMITAGQADGADDACLVLDNGMAVVSIAIEGGALVDFHLRASEVNPFTWKESSPTGPGAMLQGHFLCLDRWGAATPAEAKNGAPYHGEAARVTWRIDQPPNSAPEGVTSVMSCDLPIAGFALTRTLTLAPKSAVLTVREAVTRTEKLGRVYVMVQHPSIAPPFLDENVLVDSNAGRGYTLKGPEPVVYWPEAVVDGEYMNFRNFGSDPGHPVTAFIIKDDAPVGWVTAANPKQGVLVGYMWDTVEYPWFILWRNVVGGRPAALGLEFGTTSRGGNPGNMLRSDINGDYPRRLMTYIDAGETVTRTYWVFLAPISGDFTGIASANGRDDAVILTPSTGESIRLPY